jgi:ABC-type uncharacterized transport system ATPase subunit
LEIQDTSDGIHLVLKEGADHQAILRRGVESGATILRFELVEPRLHEIFVRHAGRPEDNEDWEAGGTGRGGAS